MGDIATKVLPSVSSVIYKLHRKNIIAAQNKAVAILLQSKCCNLFKAKLEFPRGHFTVAGLNACSAT